MWKGRSLMTYGEKHGEVAINAVELYEHYKTIGDDISPKEAWEKATPKTFNSVTPGKPKDCATAAFLGLCENGDIIGIPEPPDGSRYTTSIKNKQDAIDAVKILRKHARYRDDPDSLWKKLPNKPRTHNNQMHVVTALWKAGLIKRRKM